MSDIPGYSVAMTLLSIVHVSFENEMDGPMEER